MEEITLTITPSLGNSKANEQGLRKICFNVNVNRHRLVLKSETKIQESLWIGHAGTLGPWLHTNNEDEVAEVAGINEIIKSTIAKIKKYFWEYRQMHGSPPSFDEMKTWWKTPPKAPKPKAKLIEYLAQYVTDNTLDADTARLYTGNMKHSLSGFLKWKFNLEDIEIERIDTTFIYRYESYMANSNSRLGKPFTPSTIAIYLDKLKAVLRHAKKMGEIQIDITEGFESISKPNKEAVIVNNIREAVFWKISPEDLHKIEVIKVSSKHIKGENEVNIGANQNVYDLERPRLLFLLQTWTGFAYADLCAMKDVRTFIRMDLVGKKSIIYNRAKTGELAMIPLFPQTEEILAALDYNANPRSSYDTYKRKIKALLSQYVITLNKDESSITHLGRHLFGSRMLAKGFSMESVSRMMGHSSIRQTEKVYARIDITKINADYSRVIELEKVGTQIAV